VCVCVRLASLSFSFSLRTFCAQAPLPQTQLLQPAAAALAALQGARCGWRCSVRPVGGWLLLVVCRECAAAATPACTLLKPSLPRPCDDELLGGARACLTPEPWRQASRQTAVELVCSCGCNHSCVADVSHTNERSRRAVGTWRGLAGAAGRRPCPLNSYAGCHERVKRHGQSVGGDECRA
jgi:hypothetical protein